jgi:response regulator RpfG family c-di-GMP phosphodiesterase
MDERLRVLIVEDSEDDALLLIRALKKGSGEPEYERVESAEAMRAALREKTWDVILCDYQLPKFNGLAAIALLKESGIDIPLIIVSGAIGEETAADCMRFGANDYVMKGNLSRLVPAIERELKEAESRVRRKRAEEQLLESLEQLRRAVETTIQVLVMAVEVKDPYTAGHQRRMTNLARAMATEMGLPPEKIEGLRMAGVIHDIGKITLPTEILSKPTKLSAIELSLIREHVRLGHDILKDVESSWPLAEIVLQHHERMDGSGYPRGLKGEDILIEARILAVADVVEAMASYRPYRPALGIDAALEEIEKNRGILYDEAVADVCLTVFRTKGYQFEGS